MCGKAKMSESLGPTSRLESVEVKCWPEAGAIVLAGELGEWKAVM